MTLLKTVLNTETPILECTCFRIRQLELYYGRDMILAILLSKDIIPDLKWIEVEKSKSNWMTDKVDSEVLRLHLTNLVQTYGKKVFKQSVAIVLQTKQRGAA